MKIYKAHKQEETKDPGVIYLPYIMQVHTEESLKKHKKFKDEYHRKHELCPKCGEKSHSTTLVAYISSNDEDYKDKNSCVCMKCKHQHIAHDRISKEEFRLIKLKRLINDN